MLVTSDAQSQVASVVACRGLKRTLCSLTIREFCIRRHRTGQTLRASRCAIAASESEMAPSNDRCRGPPEHVHLADNRLMPMVTLDPQR